LLAEAAHAAPARWRDCIDACLRLDPRTRVYGSLAWQHLTGLPYLSDTSDLDLLWQLPPASDVDALLAGIATIAREAPMRIDGEVVGAAGGVQWRELLGDRVDDVLVKASSGILPMSRLEFLAGGAA
jgi:phosphoribosyl-dephospho-CoA transferase